MRAVRNTFEIFKRELKAYFTSALAYVVIVVFLLLAGFFAFFIEAYYEVGQAELRRALFFWHPWLFLFLVPAISMRLWADERREGTIELLLTLPITPTQAILGKFLAAWVFLGVALLLTFPIVPTTAYWLHGNLDGGIVFTGYLASFMIGGTYLSVGMLTSALTRNQVIAFVTSLAVCFVFIIAMYAPFLRIFVDAPAWLLKSVAYFSVMTHSEWPQRGVLDLRDFGYFTSVIAVMLFATYVTLRNKDAT